MSSCDVPNKRTINFKSCYDANSCMLLFSRVTNYFSFDMIIMTAWNFSFSRLMLTEDAKLKKFKSPNGTNGCKSSMKNVRSLPLITDILKQDDQRINFNAAQIVQ